MRIAVYRKAHFNAAHRLYNPKWAYEKNLEIFGICTSPNFHGHNYEIEVMVAGEVDPETGMLINLNDLKSLIKEEIEDRFDHKNFNLDVPEFKSVIPTAENICYTIWTMLRRQLHQKYDLKVRLYETPRNFVEYPA